MSGVVQVVIANQTVERTHDRHEQAQLAEAVRIVRDTLLVRAGEVADLDWINERARQVVQVLSAMEKLA